ncbi:MAG: hypothetical protein HOW73_09115 [Polyangiaceae bacterium]|nr:hypothetical protein [Polyangiaceae bacterium]
MDAYLARLPVGLASYPDCAIKGSILRTVLERKPPSRLLSALPPELHGLVETPPASSAWVPEVHFRALQRVIIDEHFDDDEAWLSWSYETQKELYTSPLYRALFLPLTPPIVVRLGRTLWQRFRRGSTLSPMHVIGSCAEATIFSPPWVFHELDHRATALGIKAAIELAGARDVNIRVLESSATSAKLEVRWNRREG